MRGSKRGEPRLDPVRWRRPGRSALVRFAVVAALVTMAAVLLWAGPDHADGAADPPASAGSAGAAGEPGSAGGPGTAHDPETVGTAAASRPVGAASGPSGTTAGPGWAGAAAEPRPAGARAGTAAAQDGDSGAGRLAVPPGFVGVPIRLAEPTALALVHVGDHVDVFRVPETGRSPQAIAAAALVLGATGAKDPTTGGLLLALTPAEARRTVTAPGGGYAVLIRPDG